MERLSFLWAEPDQAPSIADLHRMACADPWSAKDIHTLLEADTAIAFIASVDQATHPVGFVIGRLLVDEAEIITIGVKPDARGAGVGRALLGAFARAASGAGARRIVLEVATDNVAALGLYDALGYRRVGLRAGYYKVEGRPDVDAILLEKAI